MKTTVTAVSPTIVWEANVLSRLARTPAHICPCHQAEETEGRWDPHRQSGVENGVVGLSDGVGEANRLIRVANREDVVEGPQADAGEGVVGDTAERRSP